MWPIIQSGTGYVRSLISQSGRPSLSQPRGPIDGRPALTDPLRDYSLSEDELAHWEHGQGLA